MNTVKRITTKSAADILGVSQHTIRDYIRRGMLTGKTTDGSTGFGKRYYLDQFEVDAFADGGALAAKAYRESKTAPQSSRRGRRVGAK